MGNGTVRLCSRLKPRFKQKHNEEDSLPCLETFPAGLGPLTFCTARFVTGDLVILDRLSEERISTLLLLRSCFSRSHALQALAARLDRQGAFIPELEKYTSKVPALQLRVSPTSIAALPVAICAAIGLPTREDIQCAWVHPVLLDGSLDINEGVGENEKDPYMLGEELDVEDEDVSFLTVGGFVFFKSMRSSTKEECSKIQNHGGGLTSTEYATPKVLDLSFACSIRFSPEGPLQFSACRTWEAAWTGRFVGQGRFQPVTARRWLIDGARYMCWLRPGEIIPNRNGHRVFLRHGGFAFLYHELLEPDREKRDRYFEIVSDPDLRSASKRASSHTSVQGEESHGSLPFSISSLRNFENRQLRRIHDFARNERWALVRHLLGEYPHLAKAQGDSGTTLLHICAKVGHKDTEFLRHLKVLGAAWDALDAEGRTPESLGDSTFRALLRHVWHISPDLFENPEAWFEFWDENGNGLLEADELSNALASVYFCDSVGAKWIKSFVNIHHLGGLRVEQLTCAGGLLEALQTSEELALLRQKRNPPLFCGRIDPLTAKESLATIEVQTKIDLLREQRGWVAGKRPPQKVRPLLLPAPSAEGSADPEERKRIALDILSFSFEQTRTLSGSQWLQGFRIIFSGENGIDEGGLTKAWANEIAFALWSDGTFFDVKPNGSFFKADDIEHLELDGIPVKTTSIYNWTGRFVAYALFQRCLLDCRLCAWCFHALQRALISGLGTPTWPKDEEGEDAMLSDLASLDYTVASNLWRVRHELQEEDLKCLDFTCAGKELVCGGESTEVTVENKVEYVRLFCEMLLWKRCQRGLAAFIVGFFEVLPTEILADAPEEAVLRLLAGRADITEGQLKALEEVVIAQGLVPTKLQRHPRIVEAAQWLFRTALEGDASFRSRLLEFWLGVDRIPLAGIRSILPLPRVQIMALLCPVTGELKRIASWPRERLPEGHTCGNELWMALPDSFEEASSRIHLAVENFEAGFGLK